ncbi:MAG: asparagine synthase (glutamine-hydrolyzing) [Anaerolineae bacterium]|nr:asparagine synthase (glutamine-hydrolyzing) [Anaerolineae bacterium]
MCGIVGKLNFDEQPVDGSLIRRMCATIAHRGPDDEGFYLENVVGMGMRRLSIIDLSGGHQPLSNEDGSIWIVYNGEVYNFPELRSELETRGHRFATNTDTEVIVHLYEEMGERCVTRLNGMFAFAIWDARHSRLMLARDRLGKKPLHYAFTDNNLIFASEIAAILEDPQMPRQVNYVALQQYLRLWYVPGPLTMLQGIRKLPPAHWMLVEGGKVRIERYWDVDFSRKQQFTEQEWQEQILALLEDAVRIRLISDVSLGALLSGGIDSSLVVALMSRFSDRPVKTFAIGFDDQAYNELPYARQVARHLGTDHYEDIVRPDAAEVLPKLIRHYGEPFGDDSCIPTYYVSRLTRQHVTVALSGDGGDESFGGYPRVARHVAFDPVSSLRGLMSSEVRRLLRNPQQMWLNPQHWRDFGHELAFRAREIADPVERYTNAWTIWKDGTQHILMPEIRSQIPSNQALASLRGHWRRTRGWEPVDRLLYLDLATYLPDDLQVKIDIASMAVSLEVRAPFLDYRLVELAASMPASLKFRDGDTKVLLRKLAGEMLPAEITQRGKQGFSMPIAGWLRGDLRPMMEDLLLDARCRQHGIFQPAVVEYLLHTHTSGQRDFSRHIWPLLNFELWYRLFIEETHGAV